MHNEACRLVDNKHVLIFINNRNFHPCFLSLPTFYFSLSTFYLPPTTYFPIRRCREEYCSSIDMNSSFEKSGQYVFEKNSSLYTDCHGRKFERRISPPERMMMSGSGTPDVQRFSSTSASVISSPTSF